MISFLMVSLALSFLPFEFSIADQDLPLLGENASLNLKKEDELGKGLYLKLKEKGYVIENPLLSRYLSDIGETLLSALDVRLRNYKFYLVKDSSVNAFAMPGGYIGVNAGLIMMAGSEDEVASVLAHEIAHVELMHGMQMLEKAQDVNMAGLISLLAAILIGSQDADLATAIIYSSAAGSGQAMLNFTRANEYEADRVGIGLLKESDYDPKAMVSFLSLLQSLEQTGELSGIEYIRSHPVNSNRVAEIQSRIQNISTKKPGIRRYDQFKDYLMFLYAEDALSKSKTNFARALVLTRNGQYATADKLYNELIKSDPDSIWFRYALAENMRYQGRLEDAGEIYRSLLLLYPDDFAIAAELSKVLIEQDKFSAALMLIDQQIAKHESMALAYELKVDVENRLNNDVERKIAEANYHWYSDNTELAVKLYQALLDEGVLDATAEAKIKQKLIENKKSAKY
jgi:predicted Zn-dependent protease